MQIQEQKQGAVTVLRPIGPLIQADVAQFKDRLMEVRKASLGRFVVDAAAIPYVDSKGLESLLDAHEELARSGQSLKLCAINDTIREVMTLTEVYGYFEHFEDAASAVRNFL